MCITDLMHSLSIEIYLLSDIISIMKIWKKCKELIPLKVAVVGLVVLILAVGTIPTLRTSFIDAISAIYGSVLVNLVNRDRSLQNLSNLKVNPLLEIAAELKVKDMAEKGYFAHNTPDGKTPWYFIDKAGYKYVYAGENLAVNFVDSDEIHRAWMNSPTHRLNIVNPKYTEIGIATSTGIYKGREAVFVVQMFGTPIE